MCRSDTSETKAQQKRAFPCATMAHILSYGFSMPCKRQALISSLPSYPHQARFYRYVLICFIDSFIWLCLTSFTAAPLICGLAFLYQVSAVSFAWLCGGDWKYSTQNSKLTYTFYTVFNRTLFSCFELLYKTSGRFPAAQTSNYFFLITAKAQ